MYNLADGPIASNLTLKKLMADVLKSIKKADVADDFEKRPISSAKHRPGRRCIKVIGDLGALITI